VRNLRSSAVDTNTILLRSPYSWATIGACALVFLTAFEALAVATNMPEISRDFGGVRFYTMAFAGPLATGVIGMVAAGNFAGRLVQGLGAAQ
jgi:hypothetical protein